MYYDFPVWKLTEKNASINVNKNWKKNKGKKEKRKKEKKIKGKEIGRPNLFHEMANSNNKKEGQKRWKMNSRKRKEHLVDQTKEEFCLLAWLTVPKEKQYLEEVKWRVLMCLKATSRFWMPETLTLRTP